MLIHSIYAVLAVLLFWIVNWLGRHSSAYRYVSLSVLAKADEAPAFNFFFRVTIPLAFMIVVSSFSYAIHQDRLAQTSFYIPLYYFCFRLLFNVLLGRSSLLDWPAQVTQLTIGVGLAYFIGRRLVSTQLYLLPKLQDFGNQLWMIMLAFFYALFNNVQVSSARTPKRHANYIGRQLNTYLRQFGGIVDEYGLDNSTKALVYAVMMYEDFNRPRVVRWCENVCIRLGMAKTAGIMQVRTDRVISDEDSVKIGVQKIIHDLTDAEKEIIGETQDGQHNNVVQEQNRRAMIMDKAIQKYNGGNFYRGEILQLQTKLVSLISGEE